MWSAIWKCPVSVPEAPDKDVLMFSLGRPHVFLLICEPGGGSRLALLANNLLKGPGNWERWSHKVYLWHAWWHFYSAISHLPPFATSLSPSLTHTVIHTLSYSEHIYHLLNMAVVWPCCSGLWLICTLSQFVSLTLFCPSPPSVRLSLSVSFLSSCFFISSAISFSVFVTHVCSCPCLSHPVCHFLHHMFPFSLWAHR